ncbi:unnamed protein product [Laminaria digitata]
MESQIKSILTFEEGDGSGKAATISSPRSLEACLRSGCDPQELMPRRENVAGKNGGELPELTEIRHNFFESRRKGDYTGTTHIS